MQHKLFDKFDRLPGVPPKLLPRVKKLCGDSYADLLFHFPHSVIDRTFYTTIAKSKNGIINTLKVKVVDLENPKSKKMPFKVLVKDDSEEIMELLYFNYNPWMKKQFYPKKEFFVSGVVESDFGGKKIIHPDIYSIKSNLNEIARLEPIYPLTKGLTSKMLGKAINYAITLVPDNVEFLPRQVIDKHGFTDFKKSLVNIHQPKRLSDIEINSVYRKRIAFDELYAWQTVLVESRLGNKKHPGVSHNLLYNYESKLLNNLAFDLTDDQNRVIQEIKTDLESKSPMLRLVQGDVGSGKTIVAFISMLQAVENNKQACMMAPTEILATQHYLQAKEILEPLGIKIALLKGKMKVKEKREMLEGLASGEIQIVFGTHALIQDQVRFKQVSVVVIDEQHRFGVKQRLKLTQLNIENSELSPDVLVMTATPIPRTLSLTAYGDMDISIIREKPPGRKPIKTYVLPDSKIHDIEKSLNKLISNNEQVYWVCPLVEESEKSDLMAAKDRYEELVSIYTDDIVGLLHGKMKQAEKDQIMEDFKNGEIKILVATTVIEVGVDVPSASTMIIEHAERFGLSQLHQLRGRVGRGSLNSSCLLVHSARMTKEARERLQIMRSTEDGFIIAEKDLELRGPGETLGTSQSGYLITRVADLQADKDLIIEARNLAKTTVKDKLDDNIIFLQKLFGKHETAKLIKSG